VLLAEEGEEKYSAGGESVSIRRQGMVAECLPIPFGRSNFNPTRNRKI